MFTKVGHFHRLTKEYQEFQIPKQFIGHCDRWLCGGQFELVVIQKLFH